MHVFRSAPRSYPDPCSIWGLVFHRRLVGSQWILIARSGWEAGKSIPCKPDWAVSRVHVEKGRGAEFPGGCACGGLERILSVKPQGEKSSVCPKSAFFPVNSSLFPPSMDDHSQLLLPPGIGIRDLRGSGTTGLVAQLPGTDTVIKFSHGSKDEDARCAVEAQVYELFEESKLDRPDSILRYHGKTERGIILEYAETGTLRQFLRNADYSPQPDLLFRWARQAAQALLFSHQNNVLHGDINCSNLFLDRYCNLKLGDFAGSSIDGSLALNAYSSSHTLPDTLYFAATVDGVAISKESEVFAFGSTLYEMVTGSEPYAELAAEEVEELYSLKRFPDTTGLHVLGPVILKCWRLEYRSMSDVLTGIKEGWSLNEASCLLYRCMN